MNHEVYSLSTLEKDKKITHITSEKRLRFVLLLSETGYFA